MQRHEFISQFNKFSELAASRPQRFVLKIEDAFPILNEDTPSQEFDRHYVFHTAWAARVIAQENPSYHVDIGSSLFFCSMVSAFVPIEYYDYRAADLGLSNLTTRHADLLSLPFEDQSIESLSCMHVVEHVGLGRYGDAVNPDGDLEAMAELARVLRPGGSLLFVVPVGAPKIAFNAHRIYSYKQVLDSFKQLQLRAFALIPGNPLSGGLILDATEEMADLEGYGCGCFWFQRGQEKQLNV